MNGERDELDEAAERLWSGDADPRLRDLQETLDAAAAEERDAFVRDAIAAGPAEGEDDVIAALTAAMDDEDRSGAPGGSTPLRGRPPMGLLVLAAAAVLAVVVAVGRFGGDLPEDPDPNGTRVILGPGDGDGLVAPVGDVEQIDAFTWEKAPTVDVVHEVRVWFGTEASGVPDLVGRAYDEPRWTPDPTDLARLNEPGTRIWWEVVEIDPVDEREARLGSAPVSRSR